MRRAVVLALVIVATGSFVALERAEPQPLPRALFGDTLHAYLPQSQQPWLGRAMWAGERPVVAPLLYKLCAQDPATITRAQTMLSAAAWIVLALVLASLVRDDVLKLVAVVVVYGLALSHAVVMWNHCVLSESLALSSLALMTATWLLLVARFSTLRLVVVCLASLLWACTRDTNAYALVAVAALVAIAVAKRRLPRAALAFVAVALVVFGYTSWSAAASRRWVHPSYNVVNRRILTSPPMLRWYVAHGLPLSPALVARAGKSPSADSAASYFDPALDDFRRWWSRNGRAAQARWLVEHPAYALFAPGKDLADEYAPDLAFYDPKQLDQPWRRVVDVVVDPMQPKTLAVWLAVMLALAALLYWRARQHIGKPVAVPIAGLALIPWLTMFVWQGDPVEIGRHCVQNAIALRLCLWLVVLLVGDAALTARRSRRPPSGTPPASSSR